MRLPIGYFETRPAGQTVARVRELETIRQFLTGQVLFLGLEVGDVDSERMLLRIERGKGSQYRNAMLSVEMLALLRQWWKVGRQQGVMHRKRRSQTTSLASIPGR